MFAGPGTTAAEPPDEPEGDTAELWQALGLLSPTRKHAGAPGRTAADDVIGEPEGDAAEAG